jgi:hypothetical protein
MIDSPTISDPAVSNPGSVSEFAAMSKPSRTRAGVKYIILQISPTQCERFELNETGRLLRPLPPKRERAKPRSPIVIPLGNPPPQIPVIQLPSTFTGREFEVISDIPFHLTTPIDSLLPSNDAIGLSDETEIDLASLSIET